MQPQIRRQHHMPFGAQLTFCASTVQLVFVQSDDVTLLSASTATGVLTVVLGLPGWNTNVTLVPVA